MKITKIFGFMSSRVQNSSKQDLTSFGIKKSEESDNKDKEQLISKDAVLGLKNKYVANLSFKGHVENLTFKDYRMGTSGVARMTEYDVPHSPGMTVSLTSHTPIYSTSGDVLSYSVYYADPFEETGIGHGTDFVAEYIEPKMVDDEIIEGAQNSHELSGPAVTMTKKVEVLKIKSEYAKEQLEKAGNDVLEASNRLNAAQEEFNLWSKRNVATEETLALSKEKLAQITSRQQEMQKQERIDEEKAEREEKLQRLNDEIAKINSESEEAKKRLEQDRKSKLAQIEAQRKKLLSDY